jgi:radical SAM superfamily enzyme YgiQ (UPF0313 family)
MKIIFVTKYEYIEPLGIMSLAAFLKQNGHECELVDMDLESNPIEEISQLRPDIVAYSVTTGKHDMYQEFNLQLKKMLSFFSVFGGPHLTFFPEFIEEEGVDAICRGEGEHALLELANALQSGKEYKKIQNLWIKLGSKIYKNECRPLIEDLDSLPAVDRELVNKYQAYKKMRRRMVLTGRGCPYNCSYCFNHPYNTLYKGKGEIVRRRSVNHVINELEHVCDSCKPTRFQFIDDTFILNAQWCLDFCKQYRSKIDIPFIAYTRVNLVTDELIKILKESGCDAILYAIEHGNERLRNQVLHRKISEDQIHNAVAIYRKYKLKTFGQNMIGVPGETIDTALETIKLNIKSKPNFAWCSIFQPYPKTNAWKYCKKNGYLTDIPIGTNYFRHSVLNLKDKRELENLHHFFGIAVSFPFLLPLIRLLIKLPLSSLYYLTWNLHRSLWLVFRVPWISFPEVFLKINRKK